jgi:hypothetical protein
MCTVIFIPFLSSEGYFMRKDAYLNDICRSLEVERATWPTSGLDFAEKLLQTIKQQANFCLDFCHPQQSVIDIHCKELIEMTNALRDLKLLKETHKIYVPLADFMQV